MRVKRIMIMAALMILAATACGPGETAPPVFQSFSTDFQSADVLDTWDLIDKSRPVAEQNAAEAGASSESTDKADMHIETEADSEERFLKLINRGEDGDRFQAETTITTAPPQFRYFKLTGQVRTSGKAGLGLIADSHDDKGPRSFGSSLRISPVPTDGEWHPIEAKIHIPIGAERMRIACFLEGPGEACFDNLSVEEIECEYGIRAYLQGPGIARAAGADDFKATRDIDRFEVVFPLPMTTCYHCPLSFELLVEPADRLISRKIVNRVGTNWVCKAVIGPMKKDEIVSMRYWSDVLLTATDFSGLPESAIIPSVDEYPEDARAWLAESKSVQKDHAKIAAAADTVLAEAVENDSISYIKAMLAFIKPIEFGKPRGCDAIQMLENGGACTSHANLGAALCRRVGIPARVIANYPTWNMAFQTHYTIEAYIHGYGWTPVETAMYKFPHDPFRQINMAHVTIQDEMDSFDTGRNAAPGVPRWSLNEYPLETGILTVNAPLNAPYCDHIAVPQVQFQDEAKLATALELAKSIWAAYLATQTGDEGDVRLPEAIESRLDPMPETPEALLSYLKRLKSLL